MTDTDDLTQEATRLADQARAAYDAYQQALNARDEAIRAAISAGVGVTALSRATGFTRQSLYAIRAGHRT